MHSRATCRDKQGTESNEAELPDDSKETGQPIFTEACSPQVHPILRSSLQTIREDVLSRVRVGCEGAGKYAYLQYKTMRRKKNNCIMRAGCDLPSERVLANRYQTLEHIMRTPSESKSLLQSLIMRELDYDRIEFSGQETAISRNGHLFYV